MMTITARCATQIGAPLSISIERNDGPSNARRAEGCSLISKVNPHSRHGGRNGDKLRNDPELRCPSAPADSRSLC
jgi:hypothetical protein